MEILSKSLRGFRNISQAVGHSLSLPLGIEKQFPTIKQQRDIPAMLTKSATDFPMQINEMVSTSKNTINFKEIGSASTDIAGGFYLVSHKDILPNSTSPMPKAVPKMLEKQRRNRM